MSGPRDEAAHALAPMRVAVVSPDRHYRAAMSLLLARRNCLVTVIANPAGLGESLAVQVCDVVVLDASAGGSTASLAALRALPPRLGVVVVSDGSAALGEVLAGTLAKWGPFDELMAAIERERSLRADPHAFETRERS
jgi:DNA-binding NtrC family response regulator